MRIYQKDSHSAIKAYFKKFSIQGNNKELKFCILTNNLIYKIIQGKEVAIL